MTIDPLNCPSCGFPKLTVDGKPAPDLHVCFYCYVRGTLSNLKMFILIVLEELDKPVTIYELADIMTAHPINRNRREFTTNSILSPLRYMTRPKNKLILTGHKKSRGKNSVGRKLNTYRISRRKGIGYLDRYLERWDKGRIVHLKQKRSKGVMSLVRKSESMSKGTSIRQKIRDNAYDRFEFFMIRDHIKDKKSK